MSQYLSQTRIEDPIYLEPNEILFLNARLSKAETDVQTIENRVDELGVEISEWVLQQEAKLAEFSSLRNNLVRQRSFKIRLKTSTLSSNSDISLDYCIISGTDIAVIQTIENRVDFKARISELAQQQDAKLFEIASLRNVLTPARRSFLKIFSRLLKLSHSSEDSRNNYIISQAEIVVRTIKIRVDELGAQISELALQQNPKLVEITSLRNVLAPVRRLPLEILSEIITLSRDSECSWVRGDIVRRNYDLVRRTFILTSVCAAWRKAAYATPRLWSRLSISMKHLLGSDMEWVHDWITRSQGVALDLNLDFCTHKFLRFRAALMSKGRQWLDHIVTRFGHKIRSLEIKGHPSFIPLLLQHSLPSLEEVSFMIGKSDHGDSGNHFPKKVEIFLNAPKLHRFTIDSDSVPGWLMFQTEHLTSFTDPVMVLLPQCSQLVSLDVSPPCNFPHSMRLDGILFPALKTLRTTYYITGDSILHYIIAPLLENLSLNHTHSDLHSLVRDMTSFQERSVTALSFLAFDFSTSTWGQVDPSHNLITILSLFPRVHTLSLKIHFCKLEPLFQAMMRGFYDDLQHQLLPSLTDLTLRGGFDLSAGLKFMVLSRWWPDRIKSGEPVLVRDGISRLQKVTLDIPCVKVKHLDISALWLGLGLQDCNK